MEQEPGTRDFQAEMKDYFNKTDEKDGKKEGWTDEHGVLHEGSRQDAMEAKQADR